MLQQFVLLSENEFLFTFVQITKSDKSKEPFKTKLDRSKFKWMLVLNLLCKDHKMLGRRR